MEIKEKPDTDKGVGALVFSQHSPAFTRERILMKLELGEHGQKNLSMGFSSLGVLCLVHYRVVLELETFDFVRSLLSFS